jgi:hypothetical protein
VLVVRGAAAAPGARAKRAASEQTVHA